MAQFVGSAVTVGAETAIWWGRIIPAAMAIVWTLLYARVSPRLPGGGWQNGLVYGVLVWLGSTLFILPLLSAFWPASAIQTADPGFLGLGFGGWGSAATALAAHVVYEVVLGSYLYPGEGRSGEQDA